MMRVSFIGMSNIGKTYWAKRIAAEQSIDHISCDGLIEKKLGPDLEKLGCRGLRGVAKWMGQPPAPDYEKNSALYIAYEKQVMKETIGRLRACENTAAIIDTTGSVIYTGDEVLSDLRALTRVIYLEASDIHIDSLFRRYLTNPKPLIWGDAYRPKSEETPQDALRRCYPGLLRERARRYRELAHLIIPYERHRHRAASIADMIREMAAS